jgi:hypothetical protein
MLLAATTGLAGSFVIVVVTGVLWPEWEAKAGCQLVR